MLQKPLVVTARVSGECDQIWPWSGNSGMQRGRANGAPARGIRGRGHPKSEITNI